MGRPLLWVSAMLAAGCAAAEEAPPPGFVKLSVEELEDRIQGGVLGQILGNLNGLPHEFKYIADPGDVKEYTPGLPEGARADDDTDIEWVYIMEMQRTGNLYIPPARIRALWRAHINDWIWAANNYTRQLMDLGLEPPLTGRAGLNPWAATNISGQYMTEMFSLASPAMPRTAAELGTYYAHVTVDGEPIQSAQLCSTMVSLAFVEQDVHALVLAGRAATDPESEIHEIVGFVLGQWSAHRDDWRAARKAIRDRYTRHGGVRPDINGYALNGAATIAALLYGGGDFLKTLRLAFSMGWDADNNAAMCGTILGVIHGRRWMDRQGWKIVDVYRNVKREGMPTDETITSYGRRVVEVARTVIARKGGRVTESDVFIRREDPTIVELRADRTGELKRELGPALEKDLTGGGHIDRARAVYLAIRLGMAAELRARHPRPWRWGVQRLERTAPGLVIALFKSPKPDGDAIRRAASEAGILRPKE